MGLGSVVRVRIGARIRARVSASRRAGGGIPPQVVAVGQPGDEDLGHLLEASEYDADGSGLMEL